MKSPMPSRNLKTLVAGLLVLASAVSVGCQVNVGGQTLPSGYYLNDDIQYFPKGPEFKLSREAAALKEARSSAIGPNGGR
jgi:hypothetical protein